jgi:GNAT superfamily N-acetyltransferase
MLMIAISSDSLRSLRPAAPETFDWQGRTIILRAVRREDTALLRVLAAHVAAADLVPASGVSLDAASFAAIAKNAGTDDAPTAFVAVDLDDEGNAEALAVVQAAVGAGQEATLAIALRHDVKGRRLGLRIVMKTVEALRARGVQRVTVHVLAANEAMRALLRTLGFVMDPQRGAPGRTVYTLDALRPLRDVPALGHTAAA